MVRAGALLLGLWLCGLHSANAQSGGPLGAMVGGESSSSASAEESSGEGKSGNGQNAMDMQSDAYVHRPVLNTGLPPIKPVVDRETPQASLANFVDACEADDYRRAAYSMNLNDLPWLDQSEDGPKLARMLHEVLEQKLWIDWDDVPDRPDGQRFGYNLEKAQGNDSNRPKTFYHLGTISLDHRDVDVYLERVKVPDAQPVWVFSRRTVSAIPALYRAFGPSELEQRLPESLTQTKFWGIALWQWIGMVVFGLISLVTGLVVQRVVERLLRAQRARQSGRVIDLSLALADSVHGPIAVVVGLVVFKLLASQLLRLAGPVMAMVEPLMFVLIVLTTTWLLSRMIDFASARLSDRYEGEDHAGNAHEMLTRIKVAKHFFTVAVLLVGLGVAFWQFEWFQAMGYSLLASAGIAALVLGLAAQRPLGNLFAGVQLALTQPVRVGDAVIFNGEWGWIEEIAVTYVVIRTWDMRRLVVPTSQLMDNAVENWTKGGENMMKPVYLYADYRVNFAAVRDELERILRQSDDWDEEVPPILQVTNCTEETVELRALCSARDPSVAWNLHCQVREQLIAFLRDLDDGAYLPRTRIAMVGEDQAQLLEDQSSTGRSKGKGRPSRSEGRGSRDSRKSRKKARTREAQAAEQNRMGGDPGNDGEAKDG
ncbi:mechanosensitive ion channel family protein [Tautonia marina]|uniref:mechanosensitive ion channel family protein n=1 Tax=Tautonia marina TaxID=2653855 RepID=UPI001375C7BA|nr:mechanosensitive ion channel family protein [Tautonia marina]